VSDLVPAVSSASALRLVVAAERLFAQRGIDGVSLRQIAVDAGSANNSAVHYHFGSKEALIAAIFRHRLPQLINERRLLTARCDRDDLRSRLEAQYLPVLNMAESPDNHYVSFVEQLQRHALASQQGLLDLPPDGQRSNDEFLEDLHRLVDDLPERLRRLRVAEAQALCIHAAADRERAVTAGAPSEPFALFAGSILDGITGFLTAPASDATIQSLRDPGTDEPGALRLL
jgi:AcrR family transcriptional regulator